MINRALSLLLALVMVFGLLPVTAQAGGSSDGLEYMIRGDHVEVIGYSGKAKAVVIPATYAGLPVTSINDQAFYDCDNITNISIPDSVTFIGSGAFRYCESLTSISIPKGVTYIGDYTFFNCENLTSISIPAGIISIGKSAFQYCESLTSISIPDGIISIGKSAFQYCESLTSISIPDSVTYIGDYAFSYCKSLASISIPDSVATIGKSAFSYCENLTNISIPKGLTSIGDYTFNYCESLASISIPDSVTSIGRAAFSACDSLTSVFISDSVTSIGEDAFQNCDSLTSIIIPGSVTDIGYSAFAYCDKLASIYFEGNTPEFRYDVFNGVTAHAYYPSGNPTWTVLKGYGGNITWVPYIPPFCDVLASSFYAAPVLWAVEKGITTGASATSFNPNGQCQRAQVVTFLHRAAENPEPSSHKNPFTDVKSSDFFYKPVLWAVEKGITNGISATKFGSYDVCNRAAVVTFLWRAAGEPEPQSTSHPFVDVKPADFFYKPVLWAVENDITNGISATAFGPTSPCNRAQVVTFLYRAYN